MRRWTAQAAVWTCVAAMVLASTWVHALHRGAHAGAGTVTPALVFARASADDGRSGLSQDSDRSDCAICLALAVHHAPSLTPPVAVTASGTYLSAGVRLTPVVLPARCFLPLGARAPPAQA